MAFHGCSRHSTRRASLAAPVRAAYKGVVSKVDANYNKTALSQLLTPPAASPCKWTYNYLTAPQGVPNGITFVPMVFGHFNFKPNGDLTGSAYSELQTYGKDNYIIGFNEPDGDAADQSKIKVDQAVLYWDKVINLMSFACRLPFARSIKATSGVSVLCQGLQDYSLRVGCCFSCTVFKCSCSEIYNCCRGWCTLYKVWLIEVG